MTEEYMVKGFDQCREKVGRWPQEIQTIMKPLITQLEKYDKSEIWHSLFKFVYYFNSVDSQLLNVFDSDYKLPGQGTAYVPRKEKPYMYQVVLPSTLINPPATASTAAAGASGSTSLPYGVSTAGTSYAQFRLSCLSQSSSASAVKEDQPTRKKASLKRLHPEEWSDDCYYHGKKKKFVFQCVVNYLHKNGGLPVKLNIPFSMAVCVCKETVDFKEFYKTVRECKDDCITMKVKLNFWRGDSKASIQPYIKLLDDYLNHGNITDGFLKLVYHFNQVYKHDLSFYEDLHYLLKQHRNAKKTN